MCRLAAGARVAAFGEAVISFATSMKRRSAGEFLEQLGKQRKNPGVVGPCATYSTVLSPESRVAEHDTAAVATQLVGGFHPAARAMRPSKPFTITSSWESSR